MDSGLAALGPCLEACMRWLVPDPPAAPASHHGAQSLFARPRPVQSNSMDDLLYEQLARLDGQPLACSRGPSMDTESLYAAPWVMTSSQQVLVHQQHLLGHALPASTYEPYPPLLQPPIPPAMPPHSHSSLYASPLPLGHHQAHCLSASSHRTQSKLPRTVEPLPCTQPSLQKQLIKHIKQWALEWGGSAGPGAHYHPPPGDLPAHPGSPGSLAGQHNSSTAQGHTAPLPPPRKVMRAVDDAFLQPLTLGASYVGGAGTDTGGSQAGSQAQPARVEVELKEAQAGPHLGVGHYDSRPALVKAWL